MGLDVEVSPPPLHGTVALDLHSEACKVFGEGARKLVNR